MLLHSAERGVLPRGRGLRRGDRLHLRDVGMQRGKEQGDLCPCPKPRPRARGRGTSNGTVVATGVPRGGGGCSRTAVLVLLSHEI